MLRPKNPHWNFNNSVKQSKPFIDYLHISFYFPPENLPHKKSGKQLLINKIEEWCKPWTEDSYNSLPLDHSLYRILSFYKHFKGALFIKKASNYTVTIHFKGSFFIKSSNWFNDFQYVSRYINRTQIFLIQELQSVFGFNYPRFDIKVSKLDLAINFYNAHIYNHAKQTFHHKSVKDSNYWMHRGVCTGIFLSRADTNKIYFRSYDKRFQQEKDLEKARMRFNTDQFCRNEWSIRPNSLQKLGLRDWVDLQRLFFTKSDFYQLMLHLRKNRDVTYFSKPSHPYNKIHLEKGWQHFKPRAAFKDAKGIEWVPDKMVKGLIDNQGAKLDIQTIIYLIEFFNKNSNAIPNSLMKKIKEHWMELKLIPESYNFLNRDEISYDDLSGTEYKSFM